MKILVTAFDPFGGEKINPALEAVKQLENTIGEHIISKLEIPTVFHESKDVIDKELAKAITMWSCLLVKLEVVMTLLLSV